MEEELWAGSYYLNFWDKEAGKKSDAAMAYQLDGEWAARYHGDPGVFRADRVPIVLEKVRTCNIALTPKIGAANFVNPDGSPLASDSRVGMYGTDYSQNMMLWTLPAAIEGGNLKSSVRPGGLADRVIKAARR